MNESDNKLPTNSNPKKKRTYIKPKIESEELNSYGAACNGTTIGGRKASTAGPAFCNINKKLS